MISSKNAIYNELLETSKSKVEKMTTKEQLDHALTLLADWVIAIEKNGTMWDDWDNHYKAVAYGRNPIADIIKKKIVERRESDDWK